MTTFKEIMKYSPENQKVFDKLVTLCSKGLIVPYIGAGMSVFAGFPTWFSLINELYKYCFNEELPYSMDSIEATDIIKERLGEEEFYEKICDITGGNLNQEEWNRILEKAEYQAISIIPKLFSGPILTNNYDQIIEKVHKDKLPVVFPYNSEELQKALNNRKRLIFKIHGSVPDAKNIILTKNQFEKVYEQNSDLVKSLSTFFKGFNFLFLGTSLIFKHETWSNDYTTNLLEKLRDSGTFHFAILNCDKDKIAIRRKELEDRNIYPILFESGKYDSVKIILDELCYKFNNQLFKVPIYSSPYFERKKITEQIEYYFEDKNYSVLALTGTGGIGKTRIMSEYAHTVIAKERYTQVFWINAISAEKIREEIRQFVVIYKDISTEEKDAKVIFDAFNQWLKENKDYLFLLDNVENYEDIKVFFDFDQTLIGKRHILITSRLSTNQFLSIPILSIGNFTQEEALNFLELYTNQTPDTYANKIIAELGYYPIALELASAYIKEQNQSYQSYFELLEKGKYNILNYVQHDSDTVPIDSIDNISILRIENESAKELLQLCAFFAPDNINIQWFIRALDFLPQNLQNDIQTQQGELIEQLAKYSLIRINNNKISIHRLLQEKIRKELENEREIWINICVKILNHVSFSDFSTEKSQITFNEIIPHIYSIIKLSSSKTPGIGNLFYCMGCWYDSQKNYSEALEYYKEALYANNEIGDEHPSIAAIYNNMGLIHYKQANYSKALECYLKALKIYEKILGKGHPDTASIYNNIALVHHKKADFEKALKWYTKALDVSEKIFGSNHPFTETVYRNIGEVYNSLGDRKKALAWFNKALTISKNLLDEDEKKKNQNFTRNLKMLIDAIKEESKFSYEKNTDICHYTRINTLKYIINYNNNANPKFHLSNIVYMNDPSEGQVFIELLNKHIKNRKKADYLFDLITQTDVDNEFYKSHIYVGSFTTAKDILPMWSLYGDDSKGCCMVFKDDFFANPFRSIQENIPKQNLTLYKVNYLGDNNKIENSAIAKYVKELALLLQEWMPTIRKNSKIRADVINYLEEIRFLFKNDHYKYEEEVRLIIHDNDNTNAKIDDNNRFVVPRLYIEIDKKIEYKEIILGAKVEKPFDVVPFLLQSPSVEKVTRSKIKYQ